MTSPRRPTVISEVPLSEHHNSFDALNETHILDGIQEVLHGEIQAINPSHVTNR